MLSIPASRLKALIEKGSGAGRVEKIAPCRFFVNPVRMRILFALRAELPYDIHTASMPPMPQPLARNRSAVRPWLYNRQNRWPPDRPLPCSISSTSA
jgi:hypothetical protein